MRLLDAQLLLASLMNEHNLLAQGWTYGFNRRKKTFGVCKVAKKRIELSEPLTELNSEKNVRDTILHEIAHALTPPKRVMSNSGRYRTDAHGDDWKETCRRIGANPERCCSDGITPKGKYEYHCNCRKFHYHRPLKHIYTKYCNRCDHYIAEQGKTPVKVTPEETEKRKLISKRITNARQQNYLDDFRNF